MVGTAAHDELMGELAGMLALLNKGGVVITRATDFNADLNADSVAVMDFVLEVEDTYDITVPINLLSEVTTVGEFADVVARARANN